MSTLDWPTTRLTLINGLQAGTNPNGSWSEFVGIYGPVVMRLCGVCRLHDPDASDIAQEVFIRVFKGIVSFQYEPETRGRFGGWVGTIARNEISRFLKSNYRRLKRESEAAMDPLNALELDFETQWAIEERVGLAVYVLKKIQPDYDDVTWRIFEERVLLGKKPRHIAAEFGVHPEDVYRIAYRIGKRLKQEVDQLLRDDSAGETLS